MPTDYFAEDDSGLFSEDKLRHEANVRACDKHLRDLVRVHGSPPQMVQPPSWGRSGPRPTIYTPPRGISTWDALARES
jgi:hypothetical protein